jgi:hypothetical protein
MGRTAAAERPERADEGERSRRKNKRGGSKRWEDCGNVKEDPERESKGERVREEEKAASMRMIAGRSCRCKAKGRRKRGQRRRLAEEGESQE